MKHLKILLVTAFLGSSVLLQGQSDTMSLASCTQYALEHNPSIKIGTLRSQDAVIAWKNSRWQIAPSANIGLTHGYNFGRTLDPITNNFATVQSRTNNAYLNSSMVIFSGMRQYYSIRQSMTDLDVRKYEKQLQVNDLKVEIARSYLQVLLQQQASEIALEQVNYSLDLLSQMKELVVMKQRVAVDLIAIEAQLALDRLELTKAEMELKRARIRLRQQLNYPEGTQLYIYNEIPAEEPNKSVSNSDQPLQHHPSVLLSEQKVIREKQSLAIARGETYPSLQLDGTVGTGYSANNRLPDGAIKSEKQQAQENLYQAVSFTLGIPVFNKMDTRSKIERARLGLQIAQEEAQQTQQKLSNQYGNLKLDISIAKARLSSAQTALESIEELWKVSQSKYQHSLIDFTEISKVKSQLAKAQSDVLQARIQIHFNQIILGILTGRE